MTVQCACGASIPSGKRFCANCGAKVEAAAARPAPAAPQGMPPDSLGSLPVQQAPPAGRPAPHGHQHPMAASGQTVALYDTDKQPGPPGSEPQVNFAPKKQAIYPQPGKEANYPPKPAAYPAVGPMPPLGHGGMSLAATILHLIVMSIPIAGIVLSIVWGMNSTPPDRSNLAKAMIVVNGIWSIITIIFLFSVYSIISQVADISIKFGF